MVEFLVKTEINIIYNRILLAEIGEIIRIIEFYITNIKSRLKPLHPLYTRNHPQSIEKV